jgi:hypothetical protein
MPHRVITATGLTNAQDVGDDVHCRDSKGDVTGALRNKSIHFIGLKKYSVLLHYYL